MSAEERHVLVIANETVVGRKLIDVLTDRAAAGPLRVTVLAPVTQPSQGYVVYDHTRFEVVAVDGTRILQVDCTLGEAPQRESED